MKNMISLIPASVWFGFVLFCFGPSGGEKLSGRRHRKAIGRGNREISEIEWED